MKTSKLLITSLLAAAAMSAVPAHAANLDLRLGGSSRNISDSEGYDSASKTAAYDNVYLTNGTLNIDQGVITSSSFRGTSENGNGATTLNVSSGATLTITGTGESIEAGEAKFMLANWPQPGAVNVAGVLNLACGLSSRDGSGRFTVQNGGVVNFTTGLVTASRDAARMVINIQEGARVNIGSRGIAVSAGAATYNISGGTIGILGEADAEAAWSTDQALSISGNVTFDTTKYVMAGDGNSSSAATEGDAARGGTITLGNIDASSAGSSLNVSGAGTLALGGQVSLSTSIVNEATVSVGSTTVFVLSDTLKTSETGNTYSLISGGTISGWDSLMSSNFTYNGSAITVGRQLTSSAAGVVSYDASATAKALTWTGAGSSVWKAVTITETPTATPWQDNSSSNAEAFYNGDSVTFATEGAQVSVEGTVNPAAIAVSANTTFTGTGRVEAVSSSLTFNNNNNAVLTLGDNVTLALGGANGAGIAGYTSGSIAGTGTLELNLTQAWSNTLNISNANFSGVVHITGGYFSVDASNIGNGSYRLSSGVNMQTTASSTVSNNIELLGATTLHTNQRKPLTYTGTLTGPGTLEKTAAANLTFDAASKVGTSDNHLGGFKNSQSTTNFNSSSTVYIDAVTVSAGTVNFNGAAQLGTLTVSGGSVAVTGTGALSATVSSLAAGTSLSLAGTGDKSTIALSGSTSISGNLTIGNATVDASGSGDIFNWSVGQTQTITLNAGGELALGTQRQSFCSNVDFVLNGGKISGTGADNHGHALDFFQSNTVTATADSEISANMTIRGGEDKTLAFDVNDGVTLTISGNILTPASGLSDANSVLVKQGSGTLVLSGANTYNKGTRIEAGTVEVQSANALGANTVTVTGDATLQIGEPNETVLSVRNDIAVNSGKTLTLKSGNVGNTLGGVISGAGAVKATYYAYQNEALTLAGDNSFSGGLEVVGVKVSAGHANALGSGMVKIADTSVSFPEYGTTFPLYGSVNAAAAGVVLHDVSLLANNSAQLTAAASCNFTVAEGATLYLDISALGADVLTGEEVALTIAAQNAISGGRFFNEVLVGTYDSDNNWINDTKWAYEAGSWKADAGTLLLISVPEPSAFGLLAGAGALALAAARRRRKKA